MTANLRFFTLAQIRVVNICHLKSCGDKIVFSENFTSEIYTKLVLGGPVTMLMTSSVE